jgi:hypothetical protein
VFDYQKQEVAKREAELKELQAQSALSGDECRLTAHRLLHLHVCYFSQIFLMSMTYMM